MEPRLSKEEVRQFLFNQTLHAFDPETLSMAATVEYREDWTCVASFSDGASDQGKYGFEDDYYWTQYTKFRNGEQFWFSLHRIDNLTAQAYYKDGTRAFIQSQKTRISSGLKSP